MRSANGAPVPGYEDDGLGLGTLEEI
jgi:hypothetical protein